MISKKLKRNIITLFVCALVLFVAPLISGCANDVSKVKESYGIQVTTLFNFASSYSKQLSLGYSNDDYEKIASELDEYMLLIEEVSEKDKVKYEYTELNGEYKNKLEVTVNLKDKDVKYTMYYNETALKPDYDDIDEVSSKIEGYVESDGLRYTVLGEKTVEFDETEVEFKMFLDEDKTKYFVVSQEVERNENSYEYRYCENGKVIETFEVSVESKLAYKEIELEMRGLNEETSLEVKYFNSKVQIEFEMTGYEGTVIATAENGKYVYDFGTLRLERDRRL